MCEQTQELDGWTIHAVFRYGLWHVSASNWCDDEHSEGPTPDIALARLADMIRVDHQKLLRLFGLLR